ncbi:Na+/H+ antiporter subunit A [Bailinhaonella thermotolerans]|uniref:Na+/H+ antiporter subunit A n=1 Tax=Bailinhaonella thermotolerans TaxID=1070861 RepID=A0A3A4AWE3_9ACTN|nr:Na+/H+ antiporter subunit A [Bailinhaonella thermotolerans]RJL31664.1 Na+/H+ antiporter subunit A [Bailinhaonella thermotolerans]
MTALVAALFVVALAAPWVVRSIGRNAFVLLSVPLFAALCWLLATRRGLDLIHWVPSYNLNLAFRLDALSLLMAALVTGVGGLVVLYCSRYFEAGEEGLPRFAGYFLAFAASMLGLVLADDLVLLYVFWELTTVFSYLLIGQDGGRLEARRSALQALLVTTFGGLVMLLGLVMLSTVAETWRLSVIVTQPPRGPEVTAALVLILVGALSKSAILPFSVWLPSAMTAPTPVSAYLHAAAMVKAGVYLVARLSPAFHDVAAWRVTAMALGALTMVLAGWRALRETDLKLVLAYGTVSQLGFLTTLVATGTREAALAGVALLLAHALFKSTLFLVTGIIDHATGTRDLRRLTGLRRELPVPFWASVLAAASMAGLPPLLGFVAKEAAFTAYTHDGTTATVTLAALVAGSVLTFAYSARYLWGAFAPKPGAEPREVHRPGPLFLAAPVVLSLAGLVAGLVAGPLNAALTPYARTFPEGDRPVEGLALWHGVGVPLALTLLVIAAGTGLFLAREPVARLGARLALADGQEVYRDLLYRVDRAALQITGYTQRGSLPSYLGVILVTAIVLVTGALLLGSPWPPAIAHVWDAPAQLVPAGFVIVGAALALRARRRLTTVVLVGVTGYGTAMLFVLHGAPDLALTQFLVETLSLVIFILVLRRLPVHFTEKLSPVRRVTHSVIAVAVGVVVVVVGVLATGARSLPPVSVVFPKTVADLHEHNIISALIVEIRSWDTLGESAVLGIAAAGLTSLIFLRHRAPRHLPDPAAETSPRNVWAWSPEGDEEEPPPEWSQAKADRPERPWLRGSETLADERRSLIFEVVARLVFPPIILLSLYLLFSAGSSPGGGFAAAIVAGFGLVIRYLAGGRYELSEAAPVGPGLLIGLGLALSCLTGLAGLLFGGSVLTLGVWEGAVPLLGKVHLSSSLFFDLGVYLLVTGLVLDILRSLGAGIDGQVEREARPGERREETVV